LIVRPSSYRRGRAKDNDEDQSPSSVLRPPDRATLARLIRLARPYWKFLVVSAVCLAVSTLLQLSFPLLLQRIVDSAITYKDVGMMTASALVLVGVFLVQAVFNFGQTYLISYTGERLVADVRKSVFTHLQRLSLGFYDNQRVGELTSRLSNDVTVVQAGLTNNLIGPLGQVLTLVGGLTMIILIDWRLIALVLVVVPPVMLTGILFGRRLRGMSERAQAALGVATTVLEETLTAPRVVKAFGREDYEIGRYGSAVEESFNVGLMRIRTRSVFIAFITLISFAALAGIMWFGGNEVLNGNLSPGQLFILPLYIIMATAPISALTGVYAQFQEASGAAHRLFEILDTEPDIKDSPDAVPLASPARGEVELRDVTFHYVNGPDVLKELSLTIEEGSVMALVGPSGAGKTTLASLVPRFYDVADGAVHIDGHDVRTLTMNSLRDAIAIVPQDPQLFGGTIYDNIVYGRLDATEAEVEEAARAANAHDFIIDFPDAYQSIVGERGVKLSGGQRQRVAIARAILRNPRILILDEATSSLDNESERLVRDALDRLMKGRTTLIIAHRLSTVERADKIAVIEAGRLVEIGTHRELLAHAGLYYRLYTKSAAGLPLEELPPTDDLEELATREVVGTVQ
jgi:subfamily B ATP-binding cassette protein MsbA